MACKINNNSDFDISEIEDLIQDLYSYSSSNFGFKKPPVLNLVSDDQNTSPLGKTAYYDPSSMEITIYVDGRHPKDIMRSFSHELVHHNQNLNGIKVEEDNSPSLLGKEIKIIGKISSKGSLQLDGVLEGEITASKFSKSGYNFFTVFLIISFSSEV